MLCFQNAWPMKRNAVHTLLQFHIFIHYLDRIGSDHNLRIFFKTTYLILLNLQAVEGGKKCCFSR